MYHGEVNGGGQGRMLNFFRTRSTETHFLQTTTILRHHLSALCETPVTTSCNFFSVHSGSRLDEQNDSSRPGMGDGLCRWTNCMPHTGREQSTFVMKTTSTATHSENEKMTHRFQKTARRSRLEWPEQQTVRMETKFFQ